MESCQKTLKNFAHADGVEYIVAKSKKEMHQSLPIYIGVGDKLVKTRRYEINWLDAFSSIGDSWCCSTMSAHLPEENYLFALWRLRARTLDVWVVQKDDQKFYKGYYEFCLRYGKLKITSIKVVGIVRGLSVAFRTTLNLLMTFRGPVSLVTNSSELKRRLQDAGFWDLEWNLDSEIRDLRVDVEEYE